MVLGTALPCFLETRKEKKGLNRLPINKKNEGKTSGLGRAILFVGSLSKYLRKI
jgi:hypothetical protein